MVEMGKNIRRITIFVSIFYIAVAALQQPHPGNMEGIDSGVIEIAGGDINEGSSFKVYTVSLAQSIGNSSVSYAIALAGFQAPVQTIFSIIISSVNFSNANTLMKIKLEFTDYFNNGADRTKWNQVKWTYLVVSSIFDGTYSNIWAISAQFNPSNTTSINTPIYSSGSQFFVMGGEPGDCDIFMDPLMQVDVANCQPVAVNGEYQGGKIIIHAYVSGFSLHYSSSQNNMVSVSKAGINNAQSDSLGWEIVYSTNFPNGPKVSILGASNLSWIQVSFLIVRMDYYASNYPLNSQLKYSSSHIFTVATEYQSSVVVQKGGLSSYNENYFPLVDSAYSLYGVSSFRLGQPSNNTFSLLVDVDLEKYKVSSSNSVGNVIISGDFFIRNVMELCGWQQGQKALISTSKQTSVVPSSNAASVVDVTNNIPLDRLTSNPSAVVYKYGIASSTQNVDVEFTTDLHFEAGQSSSSLRVEIRVFESLNTPSLLQNESYSIQVSANGINIFEEVYVHKLQVPNFISSTYYRALVVQSTEMQIKVKVAFHTRAATQQLFVLIGVQEHQIVYNPSTNQCLKNCPLGSNINANLLPLTCISCDQTQGLFFNPKNGSCTCQPGNYLKNNICRPCGYHCSSCDSSNPDVCYSCIGTAKLVNFSCDSSNCPVGTVSVINASNIAQCKSCYPSCKTCARNQYYCTSCLDKFYLYRSTPDEQVCLKICPVGTVVQNLNCLPCQQNCRICLESTSNCIECKSSYVLYQNNCITQCLGILVSTSSGEICQDRCPEGMFHNTGSACSACSQLCKTCQKRAENCTSCKEGVLASYGVCIKNCKPNQYIDGGVCFNCSSPCTQCYRSKDYCVDCEEGKTAVEGKCIMQCSLSQFYDEVMTTCKDCALGCVKCRNTTYCLSCLNSTYSPKNGRCPYCSSQCQICGSDNRCLICQNGYTLFNGACRAHCPNSTINIGNRCLCLLGILQDDQCVSSCKSGYFLSNGRCAICDANCKECSAVDVCTSCFQGFSLQLSKCISQNPCQYGQVQVNESCSSICPKDWFFFSGICYSDRCPDSYEPNCFGGCVRKWFYECPDGKRYKEGECVVSCGVGYFATADQKCKSCPQNCDSCSESGKCSVCAQNYANSNGQCYYTVCPNGSVSVQSRCVEHCPEGTFQKGNACLNRCPSETYYFGSLCYQSCPSGSHDNYSCLQ